MSKIILEINELTKHYKKNKDVVRALDGVNLKIHEGETITLLGVNGAGKTTLSSILATLHPATSGEVIYKGKSIYNNLNEYRKNLGFCPQTPNLDSELNVENNLIFSGRYMLMSEKKIRKRVDFLLKQFDLEKYKKFEIEDLSGGNKQRVLIARSLMHNPKIIVLDEPTVGLDPEIRRHLWNVIKDLKKFGVTVILTTHYLDEAEILSDRVCLINKGKVVLTDTSENLKKQHNKTSLEEVFLHLTKESEE